MNANRHLEARTKALALRIIRLVEALPRDEAPRMIGRRLLRAGTSVGMTYRAAQRARLRTNSVAKLRGVEEEADETLYWLELLGEADLVPEDDLADLMRETEEILAMIVASRRTMRRHA